MKIKSEQIARLTDRLLNRPRIKELMDLKVDEGTVRERIRQIIAQNFQEEEAIEAEARKMLETHSPKARCLDTHKMFLLIKQRLAEKKGFVL